MQTSLAGLEAGLRRPPRARRRALRGCDFRFGAKPPSSPTPVDRPRSFRMPRSVWKISVPQRSASENARRAERHHHELLEVDVAVGVRAAVEDVHHRHGQQVGAIAAGAARGAAPPMYCVQRRLLLRRRRHARRPSRRRGSRWRRAGSCSAAVQVDHRVVERRLVERRLPTSALRDLAVDVATAFCHALAEIAALVAVAQLERLALTGGRARGHCRAAERAAVERDVDFDRGIAARVENLAADDALDLHEFCPVGTMPDGTS